MSKTVSIFGAGIAGLTVAHELINRGYNVTIYEKLDSVGGMARSRREPETGMPTEHSWRGFAPFYENFDEISKQIPNGRGGTVYNELSIPASFTLPKDNVTDPDYNTLDHLTFSDIAIASIKFSQVLLSGKDRTDDVYSKENLRNYFYPLVSSHAKDLITTLGPWLGLDQFNSSFLDVSTYITTTLIKRSHYHTDNNKEWVHKRGGKWHLMKRPTSEAWFDPWVIYLKTKGVKFVLGVTLLDLKINEGNIESCLTSVGNVTTDQYVIAINPFEFADIVLQNDILRHALPDCVNIVQDGPNIMISFRIAFSENIKMPSDKSAFSLPDSEYNITFYPQETFFDDDVYLGNGVKSLWSGTACVCNVNGSLYDLPAERCSKDQFIAEIHHQINRCEQLQAIIRKYNNNRSIQSFNVIETEVWYEWKFGKSGQMIQNESKKWVTTTNTNKFRPTQDTPFSNLFLSGSHTNTSIVIWSMEGAVESGKRTVKSMGEDVELYTHRKPVWMRPFNTVDNVLYKLCMPNVVIVICVVFIVAFAVILYLISYRSRL